MARRRCSPSISGSLKKLVAIFMTLFLFSTGVETVFAQPNFDVTGIMAGDLPIAIIDGKIVEQGGEIEGAKVVKIGYDSVTLEYQDVTFVVKIKENVQAGQQVKNTKVSPKQEKSLLNENNDQPYLVMMGTTASSGKTIDRGVSAYLYKNEKDLDRYYLKLFNTKNYALSCDLSVDQFFFVGKDKKEYLIDNSSVDAKSYSQIINPGQNVIIKFQFSDIPIEEVKGFVATVNNGLTHFVLWSLNNKNETQ